MQHYNYHQIRWILTKNWLRINISLLLGVYAKNFSTYWPFRPSEKYWSESKFTGSDVWNKMYLIMQWNSCDWGTTKVIIFTGPSKINSPTPFNDKAIDQSHKSHNACSIRQIYHNASFCNRNVHISVTKWCIVGCDTGALWDLCNKSIAIHSQCNATARDHSGYGLIGHKYTTMHHFVTEMCTFLLQNGALWDVILVHCGICATSLLQSIPSAVQLQEIILGMDWLDSTNETERQ